MKQDLTIEQLIEKAKKIKKQQGSFILMFDLVGSRRYSIKKRNKLQKQLITTVKKATKEFEGFLLKDYSTGIFGFNVMGDAAYAKVTLPEECTYIVKYINNKLPAPKRWGIAKDEYDSKLGDFVSDIVHIRRKMLLYDAIDKKAK